jgi:ubiquinone/menaquinone biosynthesis C-methylase UbiE
MINWKDHSQNYDFFMNSFTAHRLTLNFHHIALRHQNYILDDGCGTGNLTLSLLNDKHKVSAIDIDHEAIEKTRAKCAAFYHKNLDIQQMDGQNLKFPENTFDGISSMFVLQFVDNAEKYISEMFRVAKPGGKIVISALYQRQDIIRNIEKIMESEFKRTGILPKHQTEWINFLTTSKMNTSGIDIYESSKNIQLLHYNLQDAGFTNIKKIEKNPYGNYASFYTCSKPE